MWQRNGKIALTVFGNFKSSSGNLEFELHKIRNASRGPVRLRGALREAEAARPERRQAVRGRRRGGRPGLQRRFTGLILMKTKRIPEFGIQDWEDLVKLRKVH